MVTLCYVDALARLLASAGDIPQRFGMLWVEASGAPYVEPDDYPDVVYLQLERLARLYFLSAINLLGVPELANAVNTYLRQLVELLAQVLWIAGLDQGVSGDQTGAACRAICAEEGATGVAAVRAEHLPEQYHENASATRAGFKERQQQLAELKKKHSCTCRPWDEGRVSAVLRAVASHHPDAAGFDPLYQVTSNDIHNALWHRYFQEVAPGVSDMPPATNQQRARLLHQALSCYASCATTILRHHSLDLANEFEVGVRALLTNQLSRRAVNGELD
ncbi:MAG TPA: hypothetical protein VK009_14050 [Chloroflexota bacterium]|nr:hypothetical protein [Chloroflexota bacterium]